MDDTQSTRNVSVIKDADNNSIVMINDIRFKGKRSINWDEVNAYIEEFVGDEYIIAETSDVVYIGSDLPDEYTRFQIYGTLTWDKCKGEGKCVTRNSRVNSYSKRKTF